MYVISATHQIVGRRCNELAVDQVRCPLRVMITHGGGHTFASAHATKACGLHQSRYPLAPYVKSLGGQFRMDPRRPIGGART
jgi:hypothetical protein